MIALLISLEKWEEARLELEYAEKLDPKNPTLQHLLQEIKIRNRVPSQKEE
jgi:hypothetical protein